MKKLLILAACRILHIRPIGLRTEGRHRTRNAGLHGRRRTGFIIGSTKDVLCTFTPADSKFAPESYFGVVNKIGLDIGVTGTTLIKWAVLAPTNNIYAPGALAGDYVGAGAEASAAVGAGANLLIGGSQNTFTLQPLSVQAQTGVNLAVGIAEFRLRTAAG